MQLELQNEGVEYEGKYLVTQLEIVENRISFRDDHDQSAPDGYIRNSLCEANQVGVYDLIEGSDCNTFTACILVV